MLDDLDRVRANPHLATLLEHYVLLAEADPAAWQPRLAELTDVAAKEMSQLYGELFAFSLIEWNAAAVNEVSAGAAPKCYRATAAGRRVLRMAQIEGESEQETEAAAA